MNTLSTFLRSDGAKQVGWARLYALWPITLRIAIDTPLVRLLPQRSANTRYLAACVTSCAMLLIPLLRSSFADVPSAVDDLGLLIPLAAAIASLSSDEPEFAEVAGVPAARPADIDAREQFLKIERIARASRAEQQRQLAYLYKQLAPRYMNSFVLGLISSYRSNILDRRSLDGLGGDYETRWAEQLEDAASGMSPDDVAEKLEDGMWLNVASRVRALHVMRKNTDQTKALLDTDLDSGDRVAIARASTTILALQWNAYADRLLTMFMDDSNIPEDIYRTLLFLRDPDISDRLLERVEANPGFLRRCAGLFQGPLYRKPAEPALLKLLASSDRELRYDAVRAVYECSDAKLAQPAAAMASDQEPRFRVAAAYLASNLPAGAFTEVRAKFLPLLRDQEDEVKYAALRCFAQQMDLVAADVILESLRRDELAEQHKINVMQAMSKLANSTFNYNLHQWGLKIEENRRAIEQFETWLKENTK